jgi:hypothetical protein
LFVFLIHAIAIGDRERLGKSWIDAADVQPDSRAQRNNGELSSLLNASESAST